MVDSKGLQKAKEHFERRQKYNEDPVVAELEVALRRRALTKYMVMLAGEEGLEWHDGQRTGNILRVQAATDETQALVRPRTLAARHRLARWSAQVIQPPARYEAFQPVQGMQIETVGDGQAGSEANRITHLENVIAGFIHPDIQAAAVGLHAADRYDVIPIES